MLSRLAKILIFGLAPLVAGALILPAQSLAEDKTITGEVLYRERNALPPDAVLTVQLIETSPAGEPSAIIGQQVIPKPGQVPIKFEVHFNPLAVRPTATYLLEATISVDHTLWFENDSRYEVDPLTAGPQTLVLEMLKKPGAGDSSKGP
ncbi:YbaY family lipoprotein [Mesorhizobium sp. KR2-14]|uniref:YbaY family lipoprotein n=1 Tax=Mesorhizobium sp. KR2-14 TaxID=3156610 RepID=UPI0032B4A564